MNIQKFKAGSPSSLVVEALHRDGAVVVEGALEPSELSRLDRDSQNHLAMTESCDGMFFGYKTKRVGAMVGKSEICRKMATDSIVLDVMDHFLLPNCSQYQLNLSQLIAIEPGERQQIVHPDDPMFPFEHEPEMQVMINVMWALDDFTIENGATHIAPGSHVWGRDRFPEDSEIIQAEMKAGSYLIYLGSTRHGGGANRSSSTRRGVVMSYSLGWLKQSDNYFLSVPKEEVKSYPRRLQELMGYFVHKPNLNMVDGRDPIELLYQDNPSKQFKDYMPEDVQSLLKQYYEGEVVSVSKVEFNHQ